MTTITALYSIWLYKAMTLSKNGVVYSLTKIDTVGKF